MTSGSSNGIGNNGAVNYDFGGLDQKSIFEQLSEKGISWINYSNSSGTEKGYFEKGESAPGFNPDAAFYKWTWTSGKVKTNIKGESIKVNGRVQAIFG